LGNQNKSLPSSWTQLLPLYGFQTLSVIQATVTIQTYLIINFLQPLNIIRKTERQLSPNSLLKEVLLECLLMIRFA